MKPPHIAVLLASKNGAKYLDAQLASLARQSLQARSLLVSDDASTDQTVSILDRWGIEAIRGPDQGAAQNFLSLLLRCPQNAGYAAFCDQDDVWFPDKLKRAFQALSSTTAPALYGGRVWVTDEFIRKKRLSPLRDRNLGFANALVECFAGGNTLMLNRPAINLAQKAIERAQDVATHDWWLYQLISGCGGHVIFDREPCLYYRQHKGNLAGSSAGLSAGFRRIPLMFQGRWKHWNHSHIAALLNNKDMLTEKNLIQLEQFRNARELSPVCTLRQLRKLGISRTDRVGKMALTASNYCGQF